ncbi:MAG: hypothetical protein K6F28_09775 [Lachnospiraceae bacterium]|nr:hypothetical protein [Lachnospiraceae bacterium]
MLNKERIRLMTRMAAYEEREGKKDISISGYFRGDYISFQLLKSAIYATVGFALAVAMYVLYNIEMFLEEFYKMDILEFLKDILSKYCLVMAIYLVISYFVYSYRYHKAKRHVRQYNQLLRALLQMISINNRGRKR